MSERPAKRRKVYDLDHDRQNSIMSERPAKRRKVYDLDHDRQNNVDYIMIDIGSSKIVMAQHKKKQKECQMIGNYRSARGCNTPSTVAQAPSTVLYKKFEEGPAQAVGFGYIPRGITRDWHIYVPEVKIPLLPNPYDYEDTYLSQIVTARECGFESPKQFTKDFLKLAIEHAIQQSGGQQPTEGWVLAAPQFYDIVDVQGFHDIAKGAGCKGDIWINGESDCVAFANLVDISHATKKNKVAVAVVDIGAGTTDVTVSEMTFTNQRNLVSINELAPPLGFAIAGKTFDDRFIKLLHSKYEHQMDIAQQTKTFPIFTEYFHNNSKVNWPTETEDEEYPFQIGGDGEKFVLKEEDMDHIMKPPIKEICQRIIAHLSNIKLDVLLLSGGTSELSPLKDSLVELLKTEKHTKIIHNPSYSTNAVVHGLHAWVNNQDLIETKYAHITLSYIATYELNDLEKGIIVPVEDREREGFYSCAHRIMTKGSRVDGGVERVDIYFDIDTSDANGFILNLHPIDICTPKPDASDYISGIRVWNFASQCTTLTTLDLYPLLKGIRIKDLKESMDGKRRLCVQLGFKVAMDIIVEVLWRHDGLKCTSSNDKEFKKVCNIRIPDKVLMNEFRSPLQQRTTLDSTIKDDTLDDHLINIKQQAENNLKYQAAIETQARTKASISGAFAGSDVFTGWPLDTTVDPKVLGSY